MTYEYRYRPGSHHPTGGKRGNPLGWEENQRAQPEVLPHEGGHHPGPGRPTGGAGGGGGSGARGDDPFAGPPRGSSPATRRVEGDRARAAREGVHSTTPSGGEPGAGNYQREFQAAERRAESATRAANRAARSAGSSGANLDTANARGIADWERISGRFPGARGFEPLRHLPGLLRAVGEAGFAWDLWQHALHPPGGWTRAEHEAYRRQTQDYIHQHGWAGWLGHEAGDVSGVSGLWNWLTTSPSSGAEETQTRPHQHSGPPGQSLPAKIQKLARFYPHDTWKQDEHGNWYHEHIGPSSNTPRPSGWSK